MFLPSPPRAAAQSIPAQHVVAIVKHRRLPGGDGFLRFVKPGARCILFSEGHSHRRAGVGDIYKQRSVEFFLIFDEMQRLVFD